MQLKWARTLHSNYSELMATSAQSLANIIDTLSARFDFDAGAAYDHLAARSLLPKKLIPKAPPAEFTFASKKAQELATEHRIVPDCPGSGKDGKWTIKDVQGKMAAPVMTKLLASPNAIALATQHRIVLTGRRGTGKDGRILVKDVEGWLPAEDDEDDEDDVNISPRAQQEADTADILPDDLRAIHGTGKDGRILLADVKKYIKESAGEDSDED